MEITEEDYIDKAYNIYNLLNQFRSNPRKLAYHLEKIKKYLDKNTNILSEPDKIKIQMKEGENVFNDAIKYLRNLPSLPPLVWDEVLTKSAQEHVNDIGPKGLLTYQSSDGTDLEKRITKYGNYLENLGENIDFGPNDEIGIIVSMTLDDGEKERPHRNNLFINEFKKIGIACGPHQTEFQMCVMDFAYEFFPKKQNEESSSIILNSNISNNNIMNSFNINNNIIDVTENQIPNYIIDIKPSFKFDDNKNLRSFFEESQKIIDTMNNNNTMKNINKNMKSYNNTMKSNDNIMKYNNNSMSEIDQLKLQVKKINLGKKVIKKKIEIFSKVIYKLEDGSIKEVSELITHDYNI